MINRKIILASQSPRRSQLMREAGFHFEVKASDVEENYDEKMPVEEVPVFLAKKKALASKQFITSDEIILAADCVVILEGKIYGKPSDRADAVRILKQLSGKTHSVLTGVCLLSENKEHSFTAESKVYMSELSDDEIDFYLDTCKPYDKAGAYGVQEWIGHCKIYKIEGTHTNIMGLPMNSVYEALLQF